LCGDDDLLQTPVRTLIAVRRDGIRRSRTVDHCAGGCQREEAAETQSIIDLSQCRSPQNAFGPNVASTQRMVLDIAVPTGTTFSVHCHLSD
jgi:hypothetical protein